MEWVGSKRKKGTKKDDSEIFGLISCKDKAAVNSDGEDGGIWWFGWDKSKVLFWTW